MFAYCRNNPVCRIDVIGYAEESAYDDETKEDLIEQPEGGISMGNTGGEPTAGTGYGVGTPNNLNFKSSAELTDHYTRHNSEFGNAFETPQEYVDAANYVIQNGEYVAQQNAYVKFYGMNGRTNYAFVGLSSDYSHITTFHLKHASKICFG